MIRARLVVVLLFALYLRWAQDYMLNHQHDEPVKVPSVECEHALARINFYDSKPNLEKEFLHDGRE